jgi:hypothetical protein
MENSPSPTIVAALDGELCHINRLSISSPPSFHNPGREKTRVGSGEKET